MTVPTAHLEYLADVQHRVRSHQLMLLVSLLMGLDAATTWYAMANLSATELNPVMAWVMHTIGLGAFAVLKTTIGVGTAWHLYRIALHGHRWQWLNRRPWGTRCDVTTTKRDARRTLWFAAGLMTLVVVNNAIQIIIHT